VAEIQAMTVEITVEIMTEIQLLLEVYYFPFYKKLFMVVQGTPVNRILMLD